MNDTNSKQETVEIDGITYEVLEEKPVVGKKFQKYLYIKHGKNKYIVIQTGKETFSLPHLLTN